MTDPYTGCPERALEPPTRDTYLDVCCVCGEPIALCEPYYDFGGDTVHEDCLLAYARTRRKEARV